MVDVEISKCRRGRHHVCGQHFDASHMGVRELIGLIFSNQ